MTELVTPHLLFKDLPVPSGFPVGLVFGNISSEASLAGNSTVGGVGIVVFSITSAEFILDGNTTSGIVNTFAQVAQNVFLTGVSSEGQSRGTLLTTSTDNKQLGGVNCPGIVGNIGTSANVVAKISSNDFVVPVTGGSDSLFNQVVLLLRGEGSSVSDSSLSNRTPVSNTAVLSNAKAKFGTNSLFYNGSTFTQYAHTQDWSNGTQPFTFDFWINPDSISLNAGIVSRRVSNTVAPWELQFKDATSLTFFKSDVTNANWESITHFPSVPVSVTNWQHVAVVFDGVSVFLYVNGVKSTESVTVATPFSTVSSPLFIGTGGVSGFNGYVDDFRFTKETARYTDRIGRGSAGNFRVAERLTGNAAASEVGDVIGHDSVNATTFLLKASGIGQVGNVSIFKQMFVPVVGFQSNTSTGNVSGVISKTISGSMITTSVGTISAAVTAAFVSQASCNGIVGNVSTSQLCFTPLSGNVATGLCTSKPISTQPITGNTGNVIVSSLLDAIRSLSLISTGYVGVIKTNQSLVCDLSGNNVPTSVGNIVRSIPASIFSSSATGNVGSVSANMTATFGSSVIGTGTVGNVLTTNTQIKSINSANSRSLCIGLVGSLTATQTLEIYGVSAEGQVNIFGSVDQSLGVRSVGSVGNISTNNGGTVELFGINALGYAGNILPTKFSFPTGVSTISNVGNLIPRWSLGVRSVCSVGGIASTSQQTTQQLSGFEITTGIGTVRNYKYSELTGVTASFVTSDVIATYSMGVTGTGRIGSMTVTTQKDIYPTGVSASFTQGVPGVTNVTALTGVQTTIPTPIQLVVTYSMGVGGFGRVGSMRLEKWYPLQTAPQPPIVVTAGVLGTRQTLTRALTGNTAKGKIFLEFSKDRVYLGEHHEVEVPKVYEIELLGEFSRVISFKCTNAMDNIKEDLIEVTVQNKKAWIRLYTPGSFTKTSLYHVDKKGNYGESFSLSDVPENSEIYKIEKPNEFNLEFEMTGEYLDDEGAIPKYFTRQYYIKIVLDHSFQRDLIAGIK